MNNSMRRMPPPVMKVQPVKPPKVSDKESNWSKFKRWLKDNRVISGGLGSLSRLEILNKYKDALLAMSKGAESVGYGRHIKSPKKLVKKICQCGGGWSDFTNWIKDRANDVVSTAKSVGSTIANTGRRVGSAVYQKVLRPAYDYAKNKPISTAGYLAKGLSYIPSPISGALSTAGTALSTAGTLAGKGNQTGGARLTQSGKVLMQF